MAMQINKQINLLGKSRHLNFNISEEQTSNAQFLKLYFKTNLVSK